MNKIGIILLENERSKSYIQKIIHNKIILSDIIFLSNDSMLKKYTPEQKILSSQNGFKIDESVEKTLINNKLNYKKFNFSEINHPELIKYLINLDSKYFIFSGGGILKTEILNIGKKFLHLHPGIVPYFRGSTCFYYSILKNNDCGVTAFIMDESLDTGNIVLQKTFSKPNHKFIDEIYDAHIRSETLIDVLKNNLLEKENFQKQDNSIGETYFIIHPVLKHIAILNCTD
jgi:methionyl-tRNA formyltransferase